MPCSTTANQPQVFLDTHASQQDLRANAVLLDDGSVVPPECAEPSAEWLDAEPRLTWDEWQHSLASEPKEQP